MRNVWILTAGFAVLAVGESAFAQNISVQQPIFNRFSVGTTVSVPDRGGAYLGSVSRAGNERKNFGIFRSGTSTGSFRDHSGMSVHATIHDFEAMDRYLLSGGGRRFGAADASQLTGYARHAYSSLLDGQAPHVAGKSSSRAIATKPVSTTRSRFGQSRPERSAMYERLARKALDRGAEKIARQHLRMAVKYGSTTASRSIAELDRDGLARK